MRSHIGTHLNSRLDDRLLAEKLAAGSCNSNGQPFAAIEKFDDSSCSGTRVHLATLKDLCEEDKEKVARLIRQVVSLTKEKEALQSDASAEQARQAVVVEALQEQNRDLLAEVTSLRLKLLQAHGHLRTYQLKLRSAKDGTIGKAGPPLDSPPSMPPPMSANNTLAPESTPPTAEASLRIDVPAKGAHLASTPLSRTNVLDDSFKPVGFTANSSVSRPHSASVALDKDRVGTEGGPASTGSAGAVVAPSGGVWAAWAELEQRIRSVTGELAQRELQQGGPAVLCRSLEKSGVAQRGHVTERGALSAEAAVYLVSVNDGIASSEQLPGTATGVVCGPQSGTGAALLQDFRHRTTETCSQPVGSPTSGPPLIAGPALPQPLNRSRVSAALSPCSLPPISGGPVIHPRPSAFPCGARPLLPPPSLVSPVIERPEVHPAMAMPPPVIDNPRLSEVTTSAPSAGPIPDNESPSPLVAAPASTAPMDDRAPTSAFGVAPLAGASLVGVDVRQVPLDTVAHMGSPLRVPGTGRWGPGRPEAGGGALLAAVIESDLAALEDRRSKEERGGACDGDRGAEAGSGGLARGKLTRVLRFDPTVGDSGAFFYVDVCKKDEATQVGEERTSGAERSASTKNAEDTRAGASGKVVEAAVKQFVVRAGLAGDVDRSDEERGQSAGGCFHEQHQGRAKECESVADLPSFTARNCVARPSLSRQQTPHERVWSPEASLSSPMDGRGRARWVSGMLYDSALIELVEELEMEDDGRDERRDPVEWPRTSGTGGSSKAAAGTAPVLDVPRGKQPFKRQDLLNLDGHLQTAHPHLHPEVLILSKG